MEILLSVRARQARGDTDTQTHRHTDTQTHRHTDTQTHRHAAGIQAHRHTGIQAHRHTEIQAYRHTGIQAHRHTGIQAQLTRKHTGTRWDRQGRPAPASSVACFGCRVYDLFLVSDGGITAEGTGLRHLSRQICRT